MHIFTGAKNGWVRLKPMFCKSAPQDDGRYRGELPSPQCEAYIAWLEQEYKDQRDRRVSGGEESDAQSGQPTAQLEAV